jgi:hypothetical protein
VAYRKAYPEASEGTIRSSYGQVFRFAHEMSVGDPVVYPIKNSRDILIGECAQPPLMSTKATYCTRGLRRSQRDSSRHGVHDRLGLKRRTLR